MIENLLSHAANTKEKAVTAIRHVLTREEPQAPKPVEVDLERISRSVSPTVPEGGHGLSNVKLDSWKHKDVKQLEASWQEAQHSDFDPEVLKQFQNALHNLQGASTLYGGETLIRLTESLQKLLLVTDADPAYTSLIELHVQACRAAILDEQEAAAATSLAVCQALESQVMRIITRGF